MMQQADRIWVVQAAAERCIVDLKHLTRMFCILAHGPVCLITSSSQLRIDPLGYRRSLSAVEKKKGKFHILFQRQITTLASFLFWETCLLI